MRTNPASEKKERNVKDLSRRLTVSSISIAIVIVLLLFAYQSLFQYAVALCIASLAAIAIWEYGQFAKAKGRRIIMPVLVLLTILEVLSFFAAATHPDLWLAPSLIFFLGFLLLFALHFRQKNGAIVDIAASCFGLLYIAIPMGMLLGILYFSSFGKWWVAYLLVVTKITDIGAYFAGNLWGRRKLAPNISPGKTVEGAIFGFLFAVTASYLFYLFSRGFNFSLTGWEWMGLGLILGVVGQFGDLAESLLKRDANKKDSNALPGLGGVLDSVDSLLFNIPIIYFYLQYIQ
jgi:phosphatidate cytidylyltransferase